MLKQGLSLCAAIGLLDVLHGAYPAQATASNTWVTVAPMPTARQSLGATLGPDGRIYAIGGQSPTGQVLNTVEAYDPATNTWAERAPMPTAREGLGVSTGPDGLIYAIGGLGTDPLGPYNGDVATVEAYNTATNVWKTVAPLPFPRAFLASTTGPDGRIYALGGVTGGSPPINTVDVYTATTNSWAPAPSMNVPHSNLGAATTADGRVLAAGGFGPINTQRNAPPLAYAEAYSTQTANWGRVSDMPKALAGLAATAGGDGRTYALDGDSTFAYTPGSNSWATLASMPTPRIDLAAATDRNGRVYAIGGQTTNNFTASPVVEAYTTTSSTLTGDKLVDNVTRNSGFSSHVTAQPGDRLAYQIGYFNNSQALSNITITDALQPGQTFETSSCTQSCSYSGGTVTFSNLSLGTGGNHPLTVGFAVTVNEGFSGTISNTASISASGSEVVTTMPTQVTVSSTATSCSSAPLDVAGAFNLFVLRDLTQSNSDSQGRVAAGGNAQFSNYSVGAALPGTGEKALVTGGNLNFTGGSVNGNAVYGGNGKIAHVSFPVGDGAQQGSAVNFTQAEINLRSLSSQYAGLTANGTTTVRYGGVTLHGNNSGLNVFTVTANDLSQANALNVSVPTGSTVLINVQGSSLTLHSFGFNLNGVDASRLVLNLPTATSLTIQNIGVLGSILAPNAAVSFNSANVRGTLISQSLSGNGQLDEAPFTGCLPR